MPHIVVVTGASAGVGRATAVAFGKRGDIVALIARDPAGLDATVAEITAAGGRAHSFPADVADAARLDEVAGRIASELGPIDIWINNAMATVFARFDDVTAEEFERATKVTYLGMVNGTRSALRCMKPRNSGTIVQVGSALSYRSIPLQAAYCGAKFACRGFTDSLRSELRHDGSRIRLTMVQLPAVNTPQFEWALSRMPHHPQPVPPIFQPEVAAQAIVWAADARKREVWVGWPTVKAILANLVVPGLIDHYLARTNFDAQQTGAPTSPTRPSNLFEPATGRHAMHGSFDAIAKSASIQMWLSRHRRTVLLASAAIVVAGLLAI